jgi:protein-L-isoaspartate(D-aspartate) O-methyltransferase
MSSDEQPAEDGRYVWGKTQFFAVLLVLALAVATYIAFSHTDLKYTLARHRMVREDIGGNNLPERDPIENKSVLTAMGKVPRQEFVLETDRNRAYMDGPLRIGHDRTISQPYITAFMAELLELKPTDRVLEIGTGSGYEAAVLAEIAGEVYTIPCVKEQTSETERRLERLGYTNIYICSEDVYAGCEEHAPYDAIFVRGSVPEIPDAWKDQMKVGGRMVVPVGSMYTFQTLVLVEKRNDGTCFEENIMAVLFTPLPQTE